MARQVVEVVVGEADHLYISLPVNEGKRDINPTLGLKF
jgi:hypothetical protein